MDRWSLWVLSCALGLLSCSALADVTVVPETIAAVEMSNRDVNRIVCSSGVVNDAFFSEEKGVTVSNQGNNSFVKFLIKSDGVNPDQYAVGRNEFYIVCDGEVYTLMVTPKDIVGQTIRLVPGARDRIEQNIAKFGPQVEEDRAVSLTLAVMRDEIPASFRVRETSNQDLLWQESLIEGARLAKRRVVRVEGLGLTLTEYWIQPTQDITLDEGMLLDPYFGQSIFSITLESLNARAHQVTRAFVVNREAE